MRRVTSQLVIRGQFRLPMTSLCRCSDGYFRASDVDTELANTATESQDILDIWARNNPDLVDLWVDPPSDAWPECYYTPGSA